MIKLFCAPPQPFRFMMFFWHGSNQQETRVDLIAITGV